MHGRISSKLYCQIEGTQLTKKGANSIFSTCGGQVAVHAGGSWGAGMAMERKSLTTHGIP